MVIFLKSDENCDMLGMPTIVATSWIVNRDVMSRACALSILFCWTYSFAVIPIIRLNIRVKWSGDRHINSAKSLVFSGVARLLFM